MAWYAAHAIIYFEITDGSQDGFQAYENLFLVRADTPDQAWAKARDLARREEGDDDGTLRQGGRPARRVFGGIRKVISVCHEGPGNELGDGDEVTYSELVLADRPALEKLIADQDVNLLYVGRYAAPEPLSDGPNT